MDGQLFANQSETLQPARHVSSDYIWEIIRGFVARDFNARVVPFAAEQSLAPRGLLSIDQLGWCARRALDKALSGTLPREERFAKTIADGVLAALRHGPPAARYTVLFDVDDRPAKKARGRENPPRLVRPSLVPLMAALRGADARLSFGLLTARGRGYLDEELADPANLGLLAPHLDLAAVISCHGLPVGGFVSEHLPDLWRGYGRGLVQKVRACESLLAELAGTHIILAGASPDLPRLRPGRRLSALALDQPQGMWLYF